MTEAPVLAIDGLCIRFPQAGGDATPVRAASLSIGRGEMLALVGESGSGKSLTALSVLKLLPAHARLAGSIRFCGEELMAAGEDRLRQIRGHKVGMIFQEPMTSLNPLHNIEKQISEVLFTHQGLSRAAARARTLELLALVGIREPEKRLGAYPHELSGGQRQRVMIAMALANDPVLLIADEPTTALDVTLQAQILGLLQSLQEKLGLAVLLISHDLTLVRRYAQKVVVMQGGETVESAATSALFADPQHEYTRHLLAAVPAGAPVPLPAGERDTLLSVEALEVKFPLRKSFFGKPLDFIHAVDKVSLTLAAGESLGIVGESGSGKSTLAFAILRLLPAEGRACFLGRELLTLGQRELRPLRRDMQIVFQDPYGSLSPRMTVGEIVGEGLTVQGMAAAERDVAVVEALRAVGLDPDTRHRYPHEFSGGQRQRIAIARALVLKPRLIILDEPTSALDRTVQRQIIDLLKELQARYGFACLFISHDLAVVRAFCHRVLVLQQGRMVECQDNARLFSAPETEYTRRLLEAAGLDR
ncbi:MAG: peptide transporter, ATP-binding protein [Moraxellaceae bacterium]|jgi:microcin C transport system ATP-binding protein|nr:peptide transporter, ATP-binding protein [Moraxellaceae bacterium]